SDGIVDETVDRFRPTDVAGLPLSSDSTTFLTIVVPGGGSFSGGMPPFEEGSEVFVYITGMASVPDTDPRRLQLLFMNEDSETALVPLE
ncbi:MAG: hypothetical protein M8840_07210, partial [marine benthic group bacterium]|nr:hypothetical protein [Gemmatimonadota bacterium]